MFIFPSVYYNLIDNYLINFINSNKIKKLKFINNKKEVENIPNMPNISDRIHDNINTFYNNQKITSIFNLQIDLSSCELVEGIKFGYSFNKPIDDKLPPI